MPEMWVVDEFEGSMIHGPSDVRIRCYQKHGTQTAPWLAQLVTSVLNSTPEAMDAAIDVSDG